MATRQERKTLDQIKVKFRRQMADFKHSRGSLLEIFGMAIRAKMSEPSNRHNTFGKHYFGNHGMFHHVRSTTHHPTTTKQVRKQIRAAGVGEYNSRKLYKTLTGEFYQEVEA